MTTSCACGLAAVARCGRCDQPKCHTHMTHTYGSTTVRSLCAECAAEVDRENTRERQRVDVRLLQTDAHHRRAVQATVERLVAAGSPGAVPHVHVTPRRLLPDRTEPQGVDGFPVGVLRYRFAGASVSPEGEDAVMTEEAEALVLTDGRVVAVGGGELVDVDHGVVRDRLEVFARQHGVTLGT